MSTIKVTPEQLHHVSNQVDQARQQLENIRSDLTRQIMFVQAMWMGATQERFYYEFEQSRPILDKALESMVNTSKELKDIATRFQDADAQKGSLGGAFGAVGAAAMMTKSTGDSGSGDKGYRMAYNAMFGKMMPVNEKGVTDQAALQAYERDQGHLDFNRMQAVNVEPPGEDIFALQIKAFEMGIHPTTGEPVSDKYAQMMVTSLKFSQIFMAIQMVRGSMPGRSGPFKTSSSGLASKIQNNIKKAEQNLGATHGKVNSSSTISNKFPNEDFPHDGKVLTYHLESGRIKGIDGRTEVDFVINKNGELVIGKRHHTLGGREEVLAAGQLKINGQGEVRKITNQSGHYRPSPEESSMYADLLKNAGVKVKSSWLELYKFETDKDGYVVDSKPVIIKKLKE